MRRLVASQESVDAPSSGESFIELVSAPCSGASSQTRVMSRTQRGRQMTGHMFNKLNREKSHNTNVLLCPISQSKKKIKIEWTSAF